MAPTRTRGKGKAAVKAPSPAPAIPTSEPAYYAKGRGPTSTPSSRATRSSSKGTSLLTQSEITTSATLPSILEGDEGKTMPNNEIQDDSNSEADVATLMHDTQDESYRSDYVEVDDDAVYGGPFIPPKDSSSSSSESPEIVAGDDDFVVDDVPTGRGASISRAAGRGRGRGRGRPKGTTQPAAEAPAANVVPISFELMFTINLGGKSELFKMDSSSTIFDLRDKVADLVKKRNHELELLYTTCWGKRSDRFQLNRAEEWKQLLAFVGANLAKRKAAQQYHVEIYDGITAKPAGKAKAGTAGTSGVGSGNGGDQEGDGNGAPGFDSATSALTQIQAAHLCKKHGYECYAVKNNLYEPKFKKNDHIRLPFSVMLEWANECVAKPSSPAKAVPTTVPEKYIPRILRVEVISDEEDEDGLGALRVPDKPRGRTGPHPRAESPANPPVPTTSYPAPSAPMWPPYPYPPYPMPPGYGQPYPTPAYPPPSGSPIRTSAKGPRLIEWLRELEEELESDEESYVDLLPALKREGVHRVKDFALWNAADLRDSVGCSLGVAKRLLNEARIATRP